MTPDASPSPSGGPPCAHGHCPACGAALDGGGIWQHFYDEFTTGEGYWMDEDGKYTQTRRILSSEEAERVADEVAENYGATRTKGRWGRQIGIEYDRDRIEAWACPDCRAMWDRDTGALLETKLETPDNG